MAQRPSVSKSFSEVTDGCHGATYARRRQPSGLLEAIFQLPATHPHCAWTTTEETLIQVHGVGPTDITFVNPADDPRKK